MKEKKGWSVERIAKTAVLTVGILVVIAIIASLIFPNPIGANVRLITRLIFAGTVVTAVFILVMWIYRARKNKRMLKIFSALLCIVLALVIVINLAVMNFYVMINQFLYRNTADPETVVNETQVAREVTEKIEEEGLVLLRNENKALPMTETKANIFGFASDAIIYGGSGSGAADESKNVNLSTALENVGIEVNKELAEFYKTKNDEAKAKNGVTIALSDYSVKEPSVEDYENGLLENAKEFSDTAIVVFGRAGGEGADMPMDMGMYEGGTEGRHYMELTENEEAMFDMVKENFEKVIVLINSSSPMELGFLENEKVDAAMWIGGPGSVGLQGVANALCGEVNPSGRLVDTYAYDATSSPAYMNIGDFTYTGTEHENGGMLGGVAPYKFMNYQEGIYVGYRYYETAAQDGYINYEETVQYPFGYGLSYTTFEQKMGALSIEGDTVSVDVTVTNTGNVPGKEVVQLYYTPPYTKGGIEKSHVVLVAFDKTEELKPGESQTLTLSFQKEDMASYDYKEAKAYVLEKGDYAIKLMKNSHDVIDQRTYKVSETVVNRESDLVEATNQFDDVAGDIVYVSRADWAGTMPKEKAKDQVPSEEVLKALQNTEVETDQDAEDIVFKKHGLTLKDVKGLEYDDPKWEQLLEQLSIQDMEQLIGMSGWQSVRIGSVGKPEVLDVDGPAGLNGLINGTKGNQYTSAVVVGSTWNTKLPEEFGKALGDEAYANKVSGIYGPAMNIHRTPFSGRNFEYYSEDGLLSGKMGAAMVRGCNEKNVYTYIKHFVLNDQETNAIGGANWCNEQAMRELYLKPFELSVKEGKSKAIMTTWSRVGATWAGASKPLLQNVLRDEWGFEGFVITDNAMMGDFQNADQGIAAGNDMMLSSTQKEITIDETAEGRQMMRKACHNILYVVANSNALEHARPGVPGWIYAYVAFDAVILGLIALGFMGCTKKKKVKKEK
ncbi:MAG: glycoside hydrolase family 3 N-terminal domain-containing protein [[Ruminococcus] gnavus]|nr:glycoside hydrolase family 3 N-terminal domain-containing protein [Mediterraneibacter gnavus]